LYVTCTKCPEEIGKTPQFIQKLFKNSRHNNETSTWTVMDRSERLRRRNKRDRQRRAQETDEQREARSVQLKKNDYYVGMQDAGRLTELHVMPYNKMPSYSA